MLLLLQLAIIFIWETTTYAKEIESKSVQFKDVSAALLNATTGDTICIPFGTADWSGHTLKVPGGITLIGGGRNSTIIFTNKLSAGGIHYLIAFDGSNGLPNELHYIGFQGYTANNKPINNTNLNFDKGVGFLKGCINFKVSGCRFSGFANTALTISDSDKQKGVIYNNEFVNNYYEGYNSGGYGVAVYGDGISWPPLELGTENAVYVEDNYFSGNRHHIASNGSSRYVFRHNRTEHLDNIRNFAMVDAHGKLDSKKTLGSRSFEIYHNTFVYQTNATSTARAAIGIRGGDGVIFNNTISKNIVRTVNLFLEENTKKCGQYPVKCQIRSLHIWNNTHNDELFASWAIFQKKITLKNGVSSECPLSIQAGREYFLSKPANYTPYTYPHTLRKK